MARPGRRDGAGNDVAEPWRRCTGHNRRRRRAEAGAESRALDDWAAASEAVLQRPKKSKGTKLFVPKRLYADNFGKKKFKIYFLKIGLFARKIDFTSQNALFAMQNS